MKVILKENVKGLGVKGAIVEVAEGYARNFLFPKKLATPATDSLVRDLQHQKEVSQGKKDRQMREAQQMADRIKGLEVTVPMRVGEGGKLFGSVTTREIVDALKGEHGITLDRKQIELKEPIKTLGTYKIAVRLITGVTTVFNLIVVAG
ncbi:MAG: 50S ribosomal protein L9 [Firmicutes bacterium]|nr:50S ribosomal protein L9 [Bacillota bacterium]